VGLAALSFGSARAEKPGQQLEEEPKIVLVIVLVVIGLFSLFSPARRRV
jgi:hypothetical protein